MYPLTECILSAGMVYSKLRCWLPRGGRRLTIWPGQVHSIDSSVLVATPLLTASRPIPSSASLDICGFVFMLCRNMCNIRSSSSPADCEYWSCHRLRKLHRQLANKSPGSCGHAANLRRYSQSLNNKVVMPITKRDRSCMLRIIVLLVMVEGQPVC